MGGCCLPGGVCLEGVCPGGMPGGVCQTHPPVNRMTERCKTEPCRNYVADGNKEYMIEFRNRF